jgi:Asp-tRNA(Asn)/Glu-tRNA(Gln) amidotransferase B subunit
MERLASLRGTNSIEKPLGKSTLEIIERRVEDLARLLKEMESDNIEMTHKCKKLNEIVLAREKEVSELIDENEIMKADSKKPKIKNIGCQTSIELTDMHSFENARDQIS